MNNEHELKREYYQWHYDNRDTIVPADIAQWWLNKIAESREKMVVEITKKIIDEVDYVQNHSSGNYADGMVDALLKIKRDIIKNKEDSK